MSDDPVIMLLVRLEMKVDEIGAKLSNVDAELAATRADIMARLDRHEDKLSAIQDDITVNMAAVGHVRDSHAGMRKEQHSTNWSTP